MKADARDELRAVNTSNASPQKLIDADPSTAGHSRPFKIIVRLACPRERIVASGVIDLLRETTMELIEPDERRDFEAALARHNLDVNDFELSEIDTTDPKTDEIFALTGTLTITRKSTGKKREYPIGDCSTWVAEFQRDLINGDFK